MSFSKRIVYVNKHNQKVMLRHIGFGDNRLEVTETTNPQLAKYFTDKTHAMLTCRFIDEALEVCSMLEDMEQIFIIKRHKRGDGEWLRSVAPDLNDKVMLQWTKNKGIALEFGTFEQVTAMQNFVDSLREKVYDAKCGHEVIYN